MTLIGLTACATNPRKGPPAPVVQVTPREQPLAAPEPVPVVAPPAKPAAPAKRETRVYAYQDPAATPASEAAPPEATVAASPPAAPTAPKVTQDTPVAAPAQAPAKVATPPASAPAAPKPAPAKTPVVATPSPQAAPKPAPTVKPESTPAPAKPGAPAVTQSTPKAPPLAAAAPKPAPDPKPAPPLVETPRTVAPPAPEQRVVVAPPAPRAPAMAAPNLPPAADALARQAEQQRQAGDYAGAAASLERSLRIAPREPYLWNRLARVRLEQGQAAQAGNLASRSNDLAGNSPTVKQDNWRIIAETKRRAGDMAGASEAERRAGGE